MLVNDTQIDGELLVVGMYAMKFSRAGEGTKVGMHPLGTLFVDAGNSSEIMVPFQTLDNSVARETSFPTLNPAFERPTSPQGSAR